jgi:rod shape determining protein RodA
MSATPIRPASTMSHARWRPLTLRLPFDVVTAVSVLGICVASLLAIASATADDIPGRPNYYVDRQATYLAVGAVLAVLLTGIDYRGLRRLKYGSWGLLLASILLVMAAGTVARGSRRAIQIAFFSFQASELGKVLLIVALAAFAVERSRRLHESRRTATIMALALLPAALVVAQPDLGSGLVYAVIGLATLYFAGTGWRHFAVLGALAAVAITTLVIVAPAIGVTVLHDYQKQRLTAFLHPTANPREQGYQQNQSRIAIGSGQITGRGDQASQTRFNFLPEHHTDFIFAVVSERWGFVGATIVLSLYGLLIWRGLVILTIANDTYGQVVTGGIVAMLLFQVFVNVGMTVGIMPITGIPLPLMSYGGSSAITTFLAVGLLQSVYRQARAASEPVRARSKSRRRARCAPAARSRGLLARR